jgi:CRISPR/Cas system-associated protein Cas10 (large subunit of type III CRISPR-Cas system)
MSNKFVALVYHACPLCGKKSDGEILMHKRFEDISKLDRQIVGYMPEPCDECKKHMAMGFLIIEVSESLTTDRKNPYRTGRIFVIRREVAERVFEDTSKGAAFVTDEATKKLGFYDQQESPH